MIWWQKLKAAAGPNPDPKNDDSEPEATLISIPTVPKYRDPLHVMLEYITEERPNCDMAIVHDDDLVLLDVLGDGSSLEELQTEVVLSCLRSSNLAIHEVELGTNLSSGNNSANADREVVRVASFSATFDGQSSRKSDSESGRMITTHTLQPPLLTSEHLTTETISCPPRPSTGTMSQVPSTTTSPTKLEKDFAAALKLYKKQTKCDIFSHPLAAQLQSCNSPGAIIAVLKAQVQPLGVDQSESADAVDEDWEDLLVPTVHVLSAFSAALGNSVELVISPLIAICAGIGVLLQATTNARSGKGSVIDMFGRMRYFFQRLVAYIEVRPSAAMTDVIVKIMVEVLLVLGNATKQVGQGRTRKIVNKVVGKNGVEDALQRLDKLTQDVARMAETVVQTTARGGLPSYGRRLTPYRDYSYIVPSPMYSLGAPSPSVYSPRIRLFLQSWGLHWHSVCLHPGCVYPHPDHFTSTATLRSCAVHPSPLTSTGRATLENRPLSMLSSKWMPQKHLSVRLGKPISTSSIVRKIIDTS
ncbi:hypothetical protein EI94DRAFT_294059 [Lactarius quietus]|nr:hypothetical protein EI94DRAFT_294059 [Lactarius quietus]